MGRVEWSSRCARVLGFKFEYVSFIFQSCYEDRTFLVWTQTLKRSIGRQAVIGLGAELS